MGLIATRLVYTLIFCSTLFGCYALQSSSGGGQTSFNPPRNINPTAIALPEGYRIEAVARNLTFPTGVAFDEDGGVYVVEAGYSYGEVWTMPRLLRIEPGRESFRVIVEGGNNGPILDFSASLHS